MPPKLLIVDDEPDLEVLVRQKFRREISKGSIEFAFAHNGAEALEKLREIPDIDLVVTDLRMPKMDGLTLLKNLPEVRPELGAVVISAYGDMDNIRTAMNRGALDFLTKPISLEDLGITINMWLEQVRQRKENLRILEEKQRLEEQLLIAKHIQQTLRPSALPQVKGFELGAWISPCDEIGGDHYDFLDLRQERIGVVVGDVSGHGVGAALLAATARAYLRALSAHVEGVAPALTELNQLLSADMKEAQFMTMVFGILDGSSSVFRFANAGHEAPLLYRADASTFEIMDTGCLPLGVGPDAQYGQCGEAHLRPGDVLALYTDGIWEAMNAANEVFGRTAVQEIVAHNRGRSAQDIALGIARAVREFCGSAPQRDDMTVVVLKCLAPN